MEASLDILRQNNDFFICDGDFVITDDGTSVLQEVTERLQSFSNEWFLDAEGLPYLSDIWGKSVSYQVAYALILETIAETNGVAYVEDFRITLDTETRAYMVNCTFKTIYDSAESLELCISQSFDISSILDTQNEEVRDTAFDALRDTS